MLPYQYLVKAKTPSMTDGNFFHKFFAKLLLEQYFVVMYSATKIATDVNTCRRVLFANEASEENIFPTSAALRQHVLQAFYKQRNVIDVSRNKELN